MLNQPNEYLLPFTQIDALITQMLHEKLTRDTNGFFKLNRPQKIAIKLNPNQRLDKLEYRCDEVASNVGLIQATHAVRISDLEEQNGITPGTINEMILRTYQEDCPSLLEQRAKTQEQSNNVQISNNNPQASQSSWTQSTAYQDNGRSKAQSGAYQSERTTQTSDEGCPRTSKLIFREFRTGFKLVLITSHQIEYGRFENRDF